MTLKVEYDPEADAAYVYLRQGTHAKTRRLDACRLVDLDAEGAPLGVDLMDVSRGVDLRGLPEADAIQAALTERGISTTRTGMAPTHAATA